MEEVALDAEKVGSSSDLKGAFVWSIRSLKGIKRALNNLIHELRHRSGEKDLAIQSNEECLDSYRCIDEVRWRVREMLKLRDDRIAGMEIQAEAKLEALKDADRRIQQLEKQLAETQLMLKDREFHIASLNQQQLDHKCTQCKTAHLEQDGDQINLVNVKGDNISTSHIGRFDFRNLLFQ